MKEDSSKNFGSRFGYIMVAAGAAIGLGNIWKFPYVAYKDGGGTFLIMYIIVCFFLGQPGVLAETAVGRFSRKNAVDAFANINPRWSFLGWIMALCTLCIDFYYLIVSGYIVKYFVAYLTGAQFGADKEAYYNAFISDPVQPLVYGAIVIIVTAGILSAGITEKVEAVCKVILPALLVILVVLGIWAVMSSDNAILGLKYYLLPDSNGLDMTTFADSCMQVLFSVGIGWAIFVTLGASVGDEHNLRNDAKWVVICDSVIAMLAGFVIIPAVVGNGSELSGGPSLIFLAMTDIFEKLPGGTVVGIFFFLAIMFAVFSTCFTIVEIPVMVIQEKAKISHKKAVWVTSLILFAGGVLCSLSQGNGILSHIGIPWIDFGNGIVKYCIYDWVDLFSGYVLLPLGTFLMAIFVSRVWGWEALNAEVTKGGGKPVSAWDKLTIGWTVPILTAVVILHAFGVL